VVSFAFTGPARARDQRLEDYEMNARTSRDADFSRGMEWAGKYFGEGNADMKAVMERRKALAFGDNGIELNRRREGANIELDRAMATGLRQLQGRLPSLGVRGGAAGAMAAPLVARRMEQARGLESDLAGQDATMQRAALADYEGTLTNERAGKLGMGAGFMSIGAGDRSNAQQYVMGQDYLKQAQEQADADRVAAERANRRAKPWYEELMAGRMPDKSPVNRAGAILGLPGIGNQLGWAQRAGESFGGGFRSLGGR
jgi:hypothetical protein